MRSRQRNRQQRRGVIIPLAAVMMVFLLGMVAFAVDTAWIVLVQTELQNAADAAALAGAQPLMDGYFTYNLPNQALNKDTIKNNAMSSARTRAKEYAAYNTAGNVSLILNDSDIEFGFLDAKGTYTPDSITSGYPNTIKVTLRRDGQANGAVNLFFARALGATNTSLTALARASLYGGNLNTIPGGTLPVTYNKVHWDAFLKTGLGPDGDLRLDGNGYAELKAYPSVKDTGAFGWLSMDNNTVAASTLRGWIDNGVPDADIQKLVTDGLIPLSSHDPAKWDWQGKPGFTASGVMDVNNYVGKTFILPLYKAYSLTDAGTGQGKNYFYHIVQFVGVRVQYTPDKNGEIIVQPAPMVVPNAMLDPSSLAPAGSSGVLSTVLSPPKLTQ